MWKLIKLKIKKTIFFIIKIIYKTKIGQFVAEKILYLSMSNVKEITYNNCSLKFISLNWITRFRINTFATKEPETLNWIDSFKEDSVFWDIGANIGLYSCYAAKYMNCIVYAFEPSIFNLELLGRNIFLNKLTEKINIIPIPLSEKLLENKLNMSTTEWGGGSSTFGQNYTQDGSMLIKKFDYKTIGLSMDQAIKLLNIPKPDYIKMDVDGIEHLIIKGGAETLKSVKSIIVEVYDNFKLQKEKTNEYLINSGFKLVNKTHSKMFDESKLDSFCFNQIWEKKN